MSQDQPANDTETRPCDCGCPERWAQHPNFPVTFDAELNEYNLVYGKKQPYHHVMRYCFWCGGRLPESRRGELFTEPDETEKAEVWRLLGEAKSAPDVLHILGEPDDVSDWVQRREPELYEAEKWTRCYRYATRWKTLIVDVFEFPDGSIAWSIFGQFIDVSKKSHGANERVKRR